MSLELIILLSMLVVFALSIFVFKLPSGVAMALAAVVGALIDGEGFPVRHLVEGAFGYLDALMIIATAMIFMKVIEATGALGTISYAMVKTFYRSPTMLMIIVAFFVMFPGMLTGLSSACILTTGALVAPALVGMGIPAVVVGMFIAMMAVFGMIAPPINIPVMIIGSGVDMPYVGFEKPLMLLTFPLAIITALYVRFRYVKKINVDEVLSKLPPSLYKKHGIKLFIPIIFVIGVMVSVRFAPEYIPDYGIPLIFMLGAVIGIWTGEKVPVIRASQTAIRESLPVIGILVGVGMFVQIMTLTGVRGYLAVLALDLPPEFLYPGIALIMPAMGSAYAASSVVGVPLVFLFLGRNEIVVTSALSLIAGLGDLMPPPSLLTVFAAQLLGIKNHFQILKAAIFPILLSLLLGIFMIIYAEKIGLLLQ
ncbi:MAG: TRAP transporter large permease subunit [Bacteroidetes bacterium]|nr:TRAP transporter large permease subunit [Bacteroidota bacterium]